MLERYEVLRRIGSGGMGAVYVGRQKAVSRDIALKVLRSDLIANEHVRQRFRREAEIIGRLRHPNTIQLIDYGESEDGLAVMVMELLLGKSLSERLKEGPLPLELTLRLGEEVAASLSEAHLLGMVHRDLKPANIFLTEVAGAYHAKVLDFGIARILDEESTRLTSTGQVFGTPRYMSPEQALSTGDVDARSDLYALGLILYECVVGQPPFVAQTSIQYLSAHTTQPPPKLRESAPDAPEALESLIDACLCKDPADRPESSEIIAKALRQIRTAIDSGSAPAPNIVPRNDRTRPPPATEPPTVRDTKRPNAPAVEGSKRGLWVAMAAVAILLAGAVASAAYFLNQPKAAPLADAGIAQLVDAGKIAYTAPDTPPDAGFVDVGFSAQVVVDAGLEVAAVDPPDAGKVRNSKPDAGKETPNQEPKDAGVNKPNQTGVPGEGVVTGPRGMFIEQDDEDDPINLAKKCSAAKTIGPGRLSTNDCPAGCVVLVGGICGGKTPLTELKVPGRSQEVVIVCDGKVKTKKNVALSPDAPSTLSCK